MLSQPAQHAADPKMGRVGDKAGYIAEITVRNLADLNFGALVHNLGWSNIEDEATSLRLRDTFVLRGMIVFKGMKPSARMQVAVSRIFGPLKDHPAKATPRDKEAGDEAQGVIDMHCRPDPRNPEDDYGLDYFETARRSVKSIAKSPDGLEPGHSGLSRTPTICK